MRNRRLLTLAVLAVAIGFAASAQASDANSPYGTAVVTLIQQDPNAGVGTFDINMRLWAPTGIGVTAQTPGLLDFVFKAVYGVDNDGNALPPTGVKVTGMTNIAPDGEVSNGGTPISGGFTGAEKIGIKYAGQSYSAPGVPIVGQYSVVGLQPVAYGPSDANQNNLRDAAILFGVGTKGRAAGDANTQNGTGSWSTPPAAFAGDTPVAHGTYNINSGGSLVVETYGVDSFDCLPGSTPSTVFVGPTVDGNTFGRPVTAVVVQTVKGTGAGTVFGNDGGAAVAGSPTSLRVVVGDVVFGSAAKLGQQSDGNAVSTKANVTINVIDANTSVTFGANQVVAGLNIVTAGAGTQLARLGGKRVMIYAGDSDALDAAENAIVANLATGVSSGSTEGIVDAGVNAGHRIGFARKTDLDSLAYTELGLTLTGDTNLDGVVDGIDLAAVNVNWDPAGEAAVRYKWYLGDMNLDGVIDGVDLALVNIWWNPAGDPVPLGAPAIPEPCTLGLLALGALGLIRRRKA